MMLVSLDTVHHQIKLTSFLRDTWVYIPTLGYNQRLNAACSSGGYQGVVDAIEYNFGIAIDGYAVVDFEMFEVLVDSLGGVDVDVTEAEANEVTNHPKVYGDVVLESGEHTLTGEQALAYCRIRKIDTDFVRTERQRTVMTAIINNAKHSNPIKLLNMAYKSAPYIETDLSKSEIRSLAMTAVSCLSGDIEQQKVPFDSTWDYSTINGNSVITINLENNKQQLYDYIYGE
jgi:LCP family protein required for cell wall assembly